MKRADKTNAWLERAKLVVVAARDRAAETMQSSTAANAPSYGVAETPLSQEVEREVLMGQAAIHPLFSDGSQRSCICARDFSGRMQSDQLTARVIRLIFKPVKSALFALKVSNPGRV